MQIVEGVILRDIHIIRKPNSIIVLLFIQNISRALRRTKFTLLSSLTNCQVDNIPYYMKFWRRVNLAILKNPDLAAL